MSVENLEIENKKDGIKLVVKYDFPTSIEDACKKYTEEVVLGRFSRQLSQEIRATALRAAKAAKAAKENTQKAASEAVAAYAPRSSAQRALSKVAKLMDGLTEAEMEIVANAVAGRSNSERPQARTQA